MSASNFGRSVAGVIALVAWIGLGVQFDASLKLVGSAPETLWVMFRYFTVIANLLVALVLTAVALRRLDFATPTRVGGVTLTIVLVGVVYALLLRGMVELSGGAKLADFITHTAVPLLVPLYWVLLAPKGELKRRDPLLWAVIPLVYFVYALVRGAFEGKYAYPFLDVARLGWLSVAAYAVAMAAGFLLAGFGMLWLDRRLAARSQASRRG